jgi:tetratricopeptide (TPR) repeat protein
LPGWQRFAQHHRSASFDLVSIAVEHAGATAARDYVEAAGLEFPTLIDDHGALARHFAFKVVPNGLLIDSAGIVRYAKFGGFSIDNPDDVAVVEQFATGSEPGPSPDASPAYALGPLEHELIETKLRLGRLLAEADRRDEAIAAWRDALRLDPANFLIRKQIWVAEYPEKFFPTIDFAWQQEQLQAERAREIAEGECGPDGCPLPWMG